MAVKIAFISASGGVGKTKIALLLTDFISKYFRDKRVLFIDLDPTAGASLLLMDDNAFADLCRDKKTLTDMLIAFQDGKPINVENYITRVRIYHRPIDFLVPGENPEDLMFQMDRLWDSPEPGELFSSFLKEGGVDSYYDVVVIDTIPFFIKRYTSLASYIADRSFIVMRPSLIDIRRTRKMLNEKILKIRPSNSYIIFNMADSRVRAGFALVQYYADEDFIRKSKDSIYKPSKEVEKRFETLKKEMDMLVGLNRATVLGIYLKRSTFIDEFPYRKGIEYEKLKATNIDELREIKGNITNFLRRLVEVSGLG